MDNIVVALVGNPNVGKSTVFNALTGSRQHTGNWPGKTVETARGRYLYKKEWYHLVDLPGTYTLSPESPEEQVTEDYLTGGEADVTLVLADATCLKRNLVLILEVLQRTAPVVVCVNLMDEAERRGITVDLPGLQDALGVPVVGISARSRRGLLRLKESLYAAAHSPHPKPIAPPLPENPEEQAMELHRRAEILAAHTVKISPTAHRLDRRLDGIFTSPLTGWPVMLLLLGLIFYLTIKGANVPSALLSDLFHALEPYLINALAPAPSWLSDLLLDGVYATTTWVIAVMLPPMAIFFPLFTLLEDAGYLPRMAFNLDRCFRCAGAHGRQSLTMCMGFGCNACGVMGCRIIDSSRERLIAILTNSFVPCNGRFPTLIALLTIFFVGDHAGLGALLLLFLIVLSVLMTLLAAKLLTKTLLKGESSSFSLELPPYRLPQVKTVLLRSVLDRTVKVLSRAVVTAAPAGLVLWLFANITVGGATLLAHAAAFLDPLGQILGLDGMILLAFLLAFPANEIVLPVLLMGYTAAGSLTDWGDLMNLRTILIENGWTLHTAVSMLLLTLFHFPCGTTLLTIYHETKSIKWTAVSVLLPLFFGVTLCVVSGLFIN